MYQKEKEKGSELLEEISQNSALKNTSGNENPGVGSIDDSDVIQHHSRMQYIFTRKRRLCPLRDIPDYAINYKNIALLIKYISDRGRILPSRVTAVSAKKQRLLAKAIKMARYMGFLTYVRR